MRKKFIGYRSRLLFILAVFPLAVFGLGNGPAAAKGDDPGNDDGDNSRFCTRTADAAAEACGHEIQDDFWIAIGNCHNLSAADDRDECKQEAQSDLDEAEEECGAQRELRLEICAALGEEPYDPQIDPDNFIDPAEIGGAVPPNSLFPLVRGRTWIYRGGSETITVTVTDETREILGVTCAVIHDVVEEDGEVIEDTKDWLAQDTSGNVWYFGEISQEFEDGELVSIDGSWTAGVDGAKPGIIMKAEPAVGDAYRQEFSLGNAEDIAEVLSLTGSAEVPAASCGEDCLITKDFTPLEPDAIEHKYYAPEIGLILELNPETEERVRLIEIRE